MHFGNPNSRTRTNEFCNPYKLQGNYVCIYLLLLLNVYCNMESESQAYSLETVFSLLQAFSISLGKAHTLSTTEG